MSGSDNKVVETRTNSRATKTKLAGVLIMLAGVAATAAGFSGSGRSAFHTLTAGLGLILVGLLTFVVGRFLE